MKVMDATVSMGSVHRYSASFTEHTELKVWFNPTGPSTRDTVSISQGARACSEAGSCQVSPDTVQEAGLEVSLKKLIAEILAGHRIDILHMEEVTGDVSGKEGVQERRADAGERRGEGWGLDFSHSEEYTERETVVFEARGVVKTADGREIGFTIGLVMDRQYAERNEVRIRAGDALKDPLVLNLDGGPVQLNGRTFAFDVDADGEMDSLPGLAAGKGYIAFDRNANGTIDNGTELFGPVTGDGLGELAGLDTDANGWIDEADEAFSRLSILSFGDDGSPIVRSMKEAGVGAVSTRGVSTPFSMMDGLTGALAARVSSTGVFLREDGTAGTIQQIDVRV